MQPEFMRSRSELMQSQKKLDHNRVMLLKACGQELDHYQVIEIKCSKHTTTLNISLKRPMFMTSLLDSIKNLTMFMNSWERGNIFLGGSNFNYSVIRKSSPWRFYTNNQNKTNKRTGK